jgi:hypothetical protein
MDLFIFLRVQENEPKENARVTSPSGRLRVAAAAGRAETRPAFAKAATGLKQSPRLYRPQQRCSAS